METAYLHGRFSALVNGQLGFIDSVVHLPFLRKVAKGVVLEIGTDVGNTTNALLLGVHENGGHLYSVDINPRSAKIYAKDDAQWTFILADSVKDWASVYIINGAADVVYIDGSHTYEAAKSDLINALSVTGPGGLILMHDVLHPAFPGVREAFEECHLPKEIHEGSWGLGVIHV